MNERKVIFKLTELQDFEFNPDESDSEQKQHEEILKEREGVFHGWHEVDEWSSLSENYITKRIALIEDVSSGVVYEVSHENIKFIN